MTLVLSLFPGIGLLDRAFEEEGFCVVRGPDLLWGGEIRRFHPPRPAAHGPRGRPSGQSGNSNAPLNFPVARNCRRKGGSPGSLRCPAFSEINPR